LKKLNIDEYWLEILIAVSGILLLVVTILAYVIRLANHAGFGRIFTILSILGVGMGMAAGLMLIARHYRFWKPNIPSAASLRTQIYRQRFDIVLVIILAIFAGFFFYEGDSLIPSLLY